jgi:membrane protein DedA with SNARE-associated domain
VDLSVPFVTFLTIVAATFVSEDLSCISVGLLIYEGRLSWPFGVASCLIGIFVGDVGLWMIGRLSARRLKGWDWLTRRLRPERIQTAAQWFNRSGWTAILAARFLPGMRLPVYVSAGLLGTDRFILWAGIAALLWTPLLVTLVAGIGDAVVGPLKTFFDSGWIALAVAGIMLFVLQRGIGLTLTEKGRARWVAHVSRLWRWEFWPAWLFYLPLAPWIAYLAFRHRGLTVPTAANPAIPGGGVVGESKYQILRQLPREWVVPSFLVPADDVDQRFEEFACMVRQRSWTFPLVLKPDAGQRGAGFRLARSDEDVRAYFEANPEPVLAQEFHAGPFEAGVFYYRIPGEPLGRLFSITDKHFPSLVGDGRSSVEELIWRHSRYRMQAATFLARLNGQASRILGDGEQLALALAGNHCQGTMFRDGTHLMTPQLERSIDAIARAFDGFFFGRFDIRYSNVEAFAAGRDFKIVELNGLTSESTNIYDPGWSLLDAYRVLIDQWRLAFEIGAANRRGGHLVSPWRQVMAQAWRFYRHRRVDPLAD